jgi:phage shock protein PspC (stress-responsive transcriptional regulator)
MSEYSGHNFSGQSKRLQRTHNGRIIAGVCSGVGEYTGIDPNILRVGLAIACFFGGLGFGIYAVAWLLVPEEGRETSIVQDIIAKKRESHGWPGATQEPYEAPHSDERPRA